MPLLWVAQLADQVQAVQAVLQAVLPVWALGDCVARGVRCDLFPTVDKSWPEQSDRGSSWNSEIAETCLSVFRAPQKKLGDESCFMALNFDKRSSGPNVVHCGGWGQDLKMQTRGDKAYNF